MGNKSGVLFLVGLQFHSKGSFPMRIHFKTREMSPVNLLSSQSFRGREPSSYLSVGSLVLRLAVRGSDLLALADIWRWSPTPHEVGRTAFTPDVGMLHLPGNFLRELPIVFFNNSS